MCAQLRGCEPLRVAIDFWLSQGARELFSRLRAAAGPTVSLVPSATSDEPGSLFLKLAEVSAQLVRLPAA